MFCFYFARKIKKVNFLIQSISFKANPIGKIQLPKINSGTAEINLYRLENSDALFLRTLKQANEENKLFNHSATGENEPKNLKNILDESLEHILSVLNINQKQKELPKAFHFLASYKKTPLGLISGFSPKLTLDNKIVFSTTGRKGEVETDWTSIWRNENNPKIKSIGTFLRYIFYKSTVESGFPVERFYTRSEIPEKSVAYKWNKKIGLKVIDKNNSDKLIPDINDKDLKSYYQPLEGSNDALDLRLVKPDYKLNSDPIIPMAITAKDAYKNASEFLKANKMAYFPNSSSVDLFDYLKI